MLSRSACLVIALMTSACNSAFSHEEEYSKGSTCEAIWYADPSEDERCYYLQEQLSTAAIENDVTRIEEAIKKGANVNGGHYQSLPVLEEAAADGRTEAVRLLIDKGARINRVRPFGQTALKSAVANGHRETVRILLEKGADICEKTEITALKTAVESGNAEIADLLMSSGAGNCS